MAKFNAPSPGTKTVNLAGGDAFSESPELEFVSLLVTSFIADQYYRSPNDMITRIKAIMGKVDPLFAAKAALFARTKYQMRSVSHVVAAEVALYGGGFTWVPSFIEQVVQRVDDMAEIMAYAITYKRKSLPMGLKKGLARAFGKFDAYQLAKYRAEKKTVSLVDVVNLVHPKPTEKNAEALRALVKGELVSKDTWETRLTQAGQSAEDEEEKAALKNAAWTDLLRTNRLGYFALLRNLRNIEQQAPDALALACERLVDEKAIRASRVLPFRFQTAIKTLADEGGDRSVLIALSRALEISLANIPKLPGKTLVVVDESGSMRGRPMQIAALFAAALVKTNDAELMLFSDDARYLSVNPLDSLATICRMIMKNYVGAGTNFVAPFARMKKRYDRIIILSDMQGWMKTHGHSLPSSAFHLYRSQYAASPHVFSFDLAGYGTLQFPERNVYCLAGFSEHVFEIMRLLEEDRNALVNAVKAIQI